MITEGDVLLFQSVDDGDISIIDGIVKLSGGLETAVYLALFGGNEDDNGIGDNNLQWWGNYLENQPEKQYRSQTQHLLRSLPVTSGNLLKIEEAAKTDLQFLLDIKAASEITVSASVPALNKIQIQCKIKAEGKENTFKFVENWKASV